MKVQGSGKPIVGSRSPGYGYLYVLLLMFMMIGAATVLTGGFNPVDPTGPDGPPTLPPYYGQDGNTDAQQIVLPNNALTPDPHGNLQLKTFTVNVCSQKSVVDFLVDTSGSMKENNKIGNLKDALQAFTKKLSNTAGIGMQTFSDEVQSRIPLDYYKNQKPQVADAIANLPANGWTRTRDGFELAKSQIDSAKASRKFPDTYKYILILMTDGVPEIPPSQPRTCEQGMELPDPRTAPAKRCFAQEMDPRVPSDVAAELKDEGVEIYSVGIYSQNGTDLQFQPLLVKLLQDVASTPATGPKAHYFGSATGSDLDKLLSNIFSSICDTPLVEGNSQPTQ